MRGDYTRFSFAPRKRYDAVLQQQGRVQLDSDWNEASAIARRRVRTLGLDLFGPVGIGETTPNAFLIAPVVGPSPDLSIAPGRIYVDGLLAEAFPEDAASYLKQPFLPDPPALPAGDVVVYLDVWEREVTWVQDNLLLDAALGGRDTTTRLQTVWQVKVTAQPGATCGMAVGAPPSAGRLSSSAIAPPTPDDPCILPPLAGYRGLENRLYRVEIQNGGGMGTARFKWSRDNGSIVSAVSGIVVAGGQTQLAVNRLGRDAVLGFTIGDWVTVTDDNRELAEEPGEMARIVDIQPGTNGITLDRALPSAGTRLFGANPAEIGARHTRVQRWDQTASTNTVDADGLILTAAGPIALEDGVRVEFTLDPAAGVFNAGDWWVFAARVATASVEVLDRAPPRGNLHHYLQLAAITGLGGPGPVPSDCRPGKSGGEGCCTVVVALGQDIQTAIESLRGAPGCVCLRAGVHEIRAALLIARSDLKLEGESPGTVVRRVGGDGPVLAIGDPKGVQRIEVSGIDFEHLRGGKSPAVISITTALAVRVEDCAARADGAAETFGIVINDARDIAVTGCVLEGTGAGGIWVTGEGTRDILLAGNTMSFDQPLSGAAGTAVFGILSQRISTGLHVAGNVISGVLSGIVVNDTPGAVPNSLSTAEVRVCENSIACAPAGATFGGAPVLFGIDLTASRSLAQNNVIRLAEGSDQHTGIRIAGSGTEAIGNTIEASSASGTAPIGISVGFGGTAAATPTANVRVENNFISSCPIGIVALNVEAGSIGGNSIAFGAADAESAGIFLRGCGFVRVEGNDIGGYAVGVGAQQGIAARIAGNAIGAGGFGVLLAVETGAVVTENRITFMAQSGVGGVVLLGRTDITQNRIAGCGLAGGAASAIGVLTAFGMLRIAGNEVLDTGVSPTGAVAVPVHGIGAAMVLEASVDGNKVGYTTPGTRDTTAEDRALVIGGLIEVRIATGAAVVVQGFPIQITGNSFVGTGRTALVELVQNQINDNVFQRFERVMFNNNYCEHLPASTPPAGAATVKLVGRVANVVGNQIKSRPGFVSVDFGGMPGPFAANVISGLSAHHSTTPAPDSGQNVLF